MNKLARFGLTLLVSMLPVAVPVSATADGCPQATDPGGDANGINPQGYANLDPEGPDTRPVSNDGADIREICFSTTYTTQKLLNSDGSVREVRHMADGLRVRVTMEEDVLPTFGPSLVVRIPAEIYRPHLPPSAQRCQVSFQAWWRGPDGEDYLEQADIRREYACNYYGTISQGFDLDISGRVITMDFALDAPKMAGFIEDGTEIRRIPSYLDYPERTSYTALQTLTFPVYPTPYPGGEGPPTWGRIDEVAPFPGFVVGSDLPPDVDCGVTPGNPQCS